MVSVAILLSAVYAVAPPVDCNYNSINDATDILNGFSLDLNADGIPDECQDCSDCDGNGLPEVVERTAASGLVGQYFNDNTGSGQFLMRVLSRIDPDINFQWNGGSPASGIPVNDFSVRWTGTITAPTTGPCTFYTTTDDGARLWVNGQILVDKWISQSPTTWSGTITLQQGQRYVFRMDYMEAGGGAEAKLEWKPNGQVRAVVPSSAFGVMTDTDSNGWPDSCSDCDGNGVVDAQEMLARTALDCNDNCVLDQCEIGQSATIGYWRFEETSGNIIDSSPNGLNGVPTGVVRSNQVPVTIIPATAQDNVGSVNLQSDGSFLVNDPTNKLSFAGDSFTVEAWVRLTTLATEATANSRQVLVQRKVIGTGDKAADFIVYVQGGNMATAGFLNYGKTSQFNGRELVLLFGNNGAASGSFWTVTANLEITDNNWHYICVSVEGKNQEARFVLDNQTEFVDYADQGHVDVSAPLLVGAHTDSTGAFNQRLLGSIDELRISSGLIDAPILLSRTGSSDCNNNSRVDGCDISSGISQDCDGNGLPDECQPDCNQNGQADVCEITGGFSPDCNHDGIPDECQLVGNDCDSNGVPDDCQWPKEDCNHNFIVDSCEIADNPSADCNDDLILDYCQVNLDYMYRRDDGSAEFGIRSIGTNMAWMNQFRVAENASVMNAIEIQFVFMTALQPVQICIWSDPNNDGNPSDAQALRVINTVAGPQGVIQRIECEETFVGLNGTSFFVGAIVQLTQTSYYPAPLDVSGVPALRKAWFVGASDTIDPNNLTANALELNTIEASLFPGKWIIRGVAISAAADCNRNAVLDVCDLAAGTSVDSNNNQRPDECEDCNSNNILDSIDIASGTSDDCQSDGTPDECQLAGGENDCNADGTPDICQLATNDCNRNSIIDSCEIAAGTSIDSDLTGIPDECEDCNNNGILDSTDVATGFSMDCQPDRVPDECQLGDAPLDIEYAYDDGTRDGNYGVSGVADLVWLNACTTVADGETIGAIRVMLGNAFSGVSYQVALWNDPNGDGVPNDAQVIVSVPSRSEFANQNMFETIQIPPTFIGPPGTSFFVGAIYRDIFGNQAPVGVDLSEADLKTWISVGATVDPNNLSASVIYGYLTQADGLIRAYGFSGSLPDDCNENQKPDGCDITDGTLIDADGDGVPDHCTTCSADINNDGQVNGNDLAAVLSAWGACANCRADINRDGQVGGVDLATLLSAWGNCAN